MYGAAQGPSEQLEGQEVRELSSAHVVLKFDNTIATVDVEGGHDQGTKDQLEVGIFHIVWWFL